MEQNTPLALLLSVGICGMFERHYQCVCFDSYTIVIKLQVYFNCIYYLGCARRDKTSRHACLLQCTLLDSVINNVYKYVVSCEKCENAHLHIIIIIIL